MSSTEDDEPPPKKARPEAKPAKMVAPPGEWSDFLELEEYPLPAGHVRAVPMPPMPDVTPPQDAKFKIDLKDLLRPYHTYANDVLPLAGMYFLKRYTKKFSDKAGNKVEEEIKLFDEVRCSFPTTTRWMVVSITGAPFDQSRKRCALIAPKF